MAQDGDFTIQVVKSLEEVAALRSVWEKMHAPPDADLDFYLTLFKTRPDFLRPHVITLKRNDIYQSILVGRIEWLRPTVGLGYGKVPLPSVRCLTLIGNGILGDGSQGSVSALINAVEESLQNKDADVAWFHRLEVGSSIHKAVTEAGGMLHRDYFPSFGDHWKVKLPGSYEELMLQRSSNTRYNIRRYTKRFKASFGEQIGIKRFKQLEDIDSLMTDTEVVARTTYHRGLNAGFLDNEENRLRMRLYASQGRLRAHILYIGARPIAFWNGFIYGGIFYIWTTGYNPDYRESRPGLYLLQEALRDLCAEKTVHEVDFGMGDAQYKRDLGDENCPEVSLHLFGSSFKGILLNVLRTPLIASSQAVRWGVNKSSLLQKTKRLWRSRLEQKSKLDGAHGQ